MKKRPTLLIVFIACCLQVWADECRIQIINNSNLDFSAVEILNHNGFLLPNAIKNLNILSKNGGSYENYSGNCFPGCGVDGFVNFEATFDGKRYSLFISYSVPYIGHNDYNYSINAPFLIKQLNDGQGSKPKVIFEITGNVTATPPPSPIAVPSNGNRIVSGSFIWDADKEGMPDTAISNWAANSFQLKIKAPTLLNRNNEGTGSNTYANSKGEFSGFQNVGKITFSINKYDGSSNRIVDFQVTDLPENVPIKIFAETLTKWFPGKNTSSKPNNLPNTQYIAFVNDENMFTNVKKTFITSIKYYINTTWLSEINGVNTGASSEIQAIINKIKGTVYVHNEDATMGKSFIQSNNATSVKANSNLNLQINQTPNASQNALDKSKLGNKAIIH